MIGIHKNREFEVYGVTFSGVFDLINLTHLKSPKNGVYVGLKFESANIYDGEELVDTDLRHLFVFAKSADELALKMKSVNKVSGVNPHQVARDISPVVYWSWKSHIMHISDCPDVHIPALAPTTIKKATLMQQIANIFTNAFVDDSANDFDKENEAHNSHKKQPARNAKPLTAQMSDWVKGMFANDEDDDADFNENESATHESKKAKQPFYSRVVASLYGHTPDSCSI